jgi:FtsP/CotA-like multicopper oxidase with cupredoxin domain
MNAREREGLRSMALRRQLSESGLSRREVARLGLLTGAAWTLPTARSAEAQLVPVPPPSPPTTPWVEPLPVPRVAQPTTLDPAPYGPGHQGWGYAAPVLTYELVARRALHSFHPELPPSVIFGFDGTFPGTTIDAWYGQPVLIRYRNDLPVDHVGFGSTDLVVHLHNFHTPAESDGGPWDWVGPGGYLDCHYPMLRAGFSTGQVPPLYADDSGGDVRESLTTLFFHYHRPEFTTAGVYRGLAGMFRIFDADDTGNELTGWRLPSGPYDVPLVFADKRFDPVTGELVFDQFATDGFLGDKLTVNGKIQPYMEVERRKYRFRFLNVGPSRFYRFVLRHNGTNRPMTQITQNGNLLEAPRTITQTELWVAERNDIIIDFSAYPEGARLYLSNRLKMRSDGRGADRASLLNPDHAASRLLNPVNQVRRNTAEIWNLVSNGGGWEHPIHIHFEEGRMLSDNGGRVPAEQDGRLDVYRLVGNGRVRLFMRLRDCPDPTAPSYHRGKSGRYVLHCHNTVHEDHAMMATFTIVT